MSNIEIRGAIEHRSDNDGYSGPGKLHGVLLTYEDDVAIIDRAGRRERFARRSIFLSPGISLNREHNPEQVIVESLGANLRLNDSPQSLDVEVVLPDDAAGRAAAADVRSGALTGFSAEFKALSEENKGSDRLVLSAVLEALALVKSPAYPKSTVEIRSKKRRRLWL